MRIQMPMAKKAKNPTGPARATTARTKLTQASHTGRILVFKMMNPAAHIRIDTPTTRAAAPRSDWRKFRVWAVSGGHVLG